MVKKIVYKMLFVALALVGTWFVVAAVLIAWPTADFKSGAPSVSGQRPPIAREESECVAEHFTMPDLIQLHACRFKGDGTLTVILLHGILGSSRQLLSTSRFLNQKTGAEVIALDLRGHGESGGIPGDIPQIGQYEDDLATVIAEVAKQRPGARLILAGHSAGGGIALRYAARPHSPAVDGYLLFAPHLGHNAPTLPTQAANSASSGAESAMKLYLGRTIGLMMFNALGIPSFNGMTTLAFNLPLQAPIHHYSYRAMVSMAPADYRTALTADKKPMLVVVGNKDEAFRAEMFADAVKLHEGGETRVIEGMTHDGILKSDEALSVAAKWLMNPSTTAGIQR